MTIEDAVFGELKQEKDGDFCTWETKILFYPTDQIINLRIHGEQLAAPDSSQQQLYLWIVDNYKAIKKQIWKKEGQALLKYLRANKAAIGKAETWQPPSSFDKLFGLVSLSIVSATSDDTSWYLSYENIFDENNDEIIEFEFIGLEVVSFGLA